MTSSSTGPSDIEEWLEKVDAVHAAVQGCVKGDIKPVDTTPLLEKLESESAEARAAREAEQRVAEQTRLERDGRKGKGTSQDYVEFCTGCHTEYIIPIPAHMKTCIHCKSNLITREERHIQLQSKVDALHIAKQARRERRTRFDTYRKQQEKKGGTNYQGWDIWEPPSDDESDDAPVSPHDPRFAAMEQDIRTREAKRAADARECEHYKQLGNTSYKQGSYDTAIAYYNQAINIKKDEKSVYTNRALCHLHQQSWSFAIKDCNTVMDIWQYLENHKFYNREQHGIICKALLRRAMAYHGLKKYEQALHDIKQLCDIYTQHEYHTSIDTSILKLKSKIESDREEAERTQHVMKDVTIWEEKDESQQEKIVVIDDDEKHEEKQQTSTSRSDADEIVYQLHEIERLSHETSLSSLSSHLTILQQLVSSSHPSHTSHSIIFRESHGITTCLALLKHADITSHISSLITICYDICVENEKNREMIGKEGGVEVLLNVLERSDVKFRFATLKLLVLLSEHESIRILLSPPLIQSRLYTCLTSYLNLITSSSSSSTLSNIQIAGFGTSVLCNCAYQITWKKYLRTTNILTLLISTLETHGVMAFHITSPSIHHIDLISRILAALANMMTDTILRNNLITNITHLTTLSSLLTLAMIMCQHKKYIIDSDSMEAIDKLLIVWLNLSVDDISCQHLFTSSLFTRFITLIQTTSLSYPLREHALGLVCRGLKHLSSSHDIVINNHGIEMMLNVLQESIEKKEEKNGFTEMAYEYAIRGVTVLTGSSSTAITHVTSLISSHTSGIDILISLLSSSNDQIAGNACLCLAHVLKDTKNVPKAKGAIVPLITLMRSSSRRSCHNNAAICCARVAAHPDHLPIIREMQGMQLMMQITQQHKAK